MLHKLFRSRNPNIPNPVIFPENPLILQIIHAGGTIERYYMAFPAAWIMQKYPNFVLARPEIFRRPWDSVVGPEEILVPGQKYFVVPVPTVRKLRRRIRKPSGEMPHCSLFQDHVDSCVGFNGVGEDEGKKKNEMRLKKRKNNIIRFSPSLAVVYET